MFGSLVLVAEAQSSGVRKSSERSSSDSGFSSAEGGGGGGWSQITAGSGRGHCWEAGATGTPLAWGVAAVGGDYVGMAGWINRWEGRRVWQGGGGGGVGLYEEKASLTLQEE